MQRYKKDKKKDMKRNKEVLISYRMKIAILCAGRISNDNNDDTIRHQYENVIENIVQNHEADFFVSHSPELDENIKLFVELYKPITFNNEPFQYVDTSNYPTRHIRHTTMSMFYNRSRVFHDFENYIQNSSVKYDVIINHRIDTLYSEKLKYEQLDLSKNDVLYIPNGKDFYYAHWSGYNDQFSIGNLYSIREYMCIYDRIIEYLDEGSLLMGEVLVKHCLCKNNICANRFNFIHSINKK